jgi:hypothetical protein
MLIDGNDLQISLASFEEAIDLKDAVEEAIKKANINIEFEGDESKPLSISDNSFNSLIKTVLNIDNSKEVRRCLFKCAKRCLWNKSEINQDLFEKIENRKHYYAIMFEILKETLSPFLEGLLSKLKGLDFLDQIKSYLK